MNLLNIEQWMKGMKIWESLINQYKREQLEKLTMEGLLEVAWFYFNNPIREDEIKKVFREQGLPEPEEL